MFASRTALICVLIAFLGACTGAPEPPPAIELHAGNVDITTAAKEYMDEHGIWYEVVSESVVMVPNPPPKQLIDFVDAEIVKLTPPGLSLAVAEDLRQAVYQRLDEQGIEYHTVMFNDMEFLVWSEEDAAVVDEVIFEAGKAALDAKLESL